MLIPNNIKTFNSGINLFAMLQLVQKIYKKMFLANKIKRQINTPKYKQSVECMIWPVSNVLYEEIVWPGEKIMINTKHLVVT